MRWIRVVVRIVAAAAAVLVLAGCGAARVNPPPSPSPSVGPTAAASPVPADGIALRTLGFQNGPPGFSVPRVVAVVTAVDQANNVVLVLSAPAPDVVGAYLMRTLPGAGFTITDDDPADQTFSFTGQGWTGSFTTGDGRSAVLLRPI